MPAGGPVIFWGAAIEVEIKQWRIHYPPTLYKKTHTQGNKVLTQMYIINSTQKLW